MTSNSDIDFVSDISPQRLKEQGNDSFKHSQLIEVISMVYYKPKKLSNQGSAI